MKEAAYLFFSSKPKLSGIIFVTSLKAVPLEDNILGAEDDECFAESLNHQAQINKEWPGPPVLTCIQSGRLDNVIGMTGLTNSNMIWGII